MPSLYQGKSRRALALTLSRRPGRGGESWQRRGGGRAWGDGACMLPKLCSCNWRQLTADHDQNLLVLPVLRAEHPRPLPNATPAPSPFISSQVLKMDTPYSRLSFFPDAHTHSHFIYCLTGDTSLGSTGPGSASPRLSSAFSFLFFRVCYQVNKPCATRPPPPPLRVGIPRYTRVLYPLLSAQAEKTQLRAGSSRYELYCIKHTT